jgi:hypothetical protein
MSPLSISMLLHFYSTATPYDGLGNNSPAYDDAVRQLVVADLIEKAGERGAYRATDRGEAHVRQMCLLPYPMRAWVTGELPKMVPEHLCAASSDSATNALPGQMNPSPPRAGFFNGGLNDRTSIHR